MQKTWWKEAVVYQIYPRSFMDSNGDGIGDLQGIIKKLDYLKNLGITVIWVSPIYKSPNKDNGYDISDYQDIMDEFGTMSDFDELLKEVHRRDMKLVLDLVANHTSDQHKWFLESRKSKDNKYRDYYIWKDPVDGHEPTNWGSYFSGSAWQFDETTGQYYLHQFVPGQPDLNWDNPVVRKEIFDMMTWWCEKGIDGFRMDVISLISKTDKKLYLPDLKEILNRWQKGLEGIAWNSLYWDNHDQPRVVSRWGNDSEEYREISAKMLATCLHMMQGTPYVYQGEELGMTNMRFSDLSECDDIEEKNIYVDLVTDAKVYTHDQMMDIISRKGRDNARTPMQWDSSENAGFTTGTPWFGVNPNYKTINAAAQVEDPESIYNYYKKLIQLRKQEEVIVYGTFDGLEDADENLYVYTRTLGDKKLLVICNFTEKELDVPASLADMVKENQGILVGNYKESSEKIRPYEAVVYWVK